MPGHMACSAFVWIGILRFIHTYHKVFSNVSIAGIIFKGYLYFSV